MAQKRQSDSDSDSDSSEELTDTEQQHPTPNQSQNTNSVDSDDVESSDEDDEREENKKPSTQKSAPLHSDSDSEDTTDSSDKSPTSSAFKIQPKDIENKSPKPAQNPNFSASKLALKKAVSDTKSNGVGERKKLQVVRIWGVDDELAIVQGMDEFRRKIGRDPCVDGDSFLEFLKNSLKVEVTKAQLMDKVRRLRKKYENNAKKGEDPVISKPHELKLFELSKKVWGGDSVESSGKADKRKAVDNGEKSKKKAKMNVEVKKSMELLEENGIREGLYLCNNLKSDQECFWDAYPHFKEALEIENSGSFSNEAMWVMMVELSKIGAAGAKEMEDKWRELFVKEMELKLLRSELVKEQTQLVLDAVKTAKP